MILFLAPYYWNQIYIREMGGHLRGTIGEIMAKLLHTQTIFYPLVWYRELKIPFIRNQCFRAKPLAWPSWIILKYQHILIFMMY